MLVVQKEKEKEMKKYRDLLGEKTNTIKKNLRTKKFLIEKDWFKTD